MLQQSAVTGFLFMIGIGLNSPTMLLGGIVATLSGLAAARLLRYDPDSIHRGLYGFNAALVGIAVLFFMPINALLVGWLICGGVLSTLIMHFMLMRLPAIPPFTAPFIISTWLIFALANVLGITLSFPPFPPVAAGDFFSVMRGVGQVMFQDYWLSGLVVVVGLFAHSRNAGVWAIIGSGSGMLIARSFGFSEELVLMGIYGFNASLVAIALSEHFGENVFPVFLGIIACVLLLTGFEWVGLPALTAPFVLASWLVLGLFRIDERAA